MINNTSIRKVQLNDMDELINLCEAHAIYEKANYTREHKKENLIKELFSDAPRLTCLVVEFENKLIGYASFTTDYSTWDAEYFLYLDCLYLYEEYRGNGIGEKLMNEVMKHAKQQNIKMIQWHTPDFNTRAIKFYHRIGGYSKNKVRFFWEVK